MEKQRADTLISEYRNKIFGFALEKMRNISRADELASDIVCEVYSSFLKAEEIANPDGYVYRIASNVYANYIKRLKGLAKTVDISEMILPLYDDSFERCEYEEDLQRLRDEIGFLSERQRKIIYMRYYENKSVSDIAGLLGISSGTVKWHLSDARSALKEELTMEKYTDDLAVNPISFSSMGHNGHPGSTGDTSDMFNTRLKQNIAWICYFTPLTVEETARKLNVPCAYIADEIKLLEEYGYLDRLDNGKNPKYRTNMYITDKRVFDISEEAMYKEAAARYCDEFYAKVFEDFDLSADSWGFSCGRNDKNFMKYTLVMLCMRFSYEHKEYDDVKRYMVKRPDGGCFIAHAYISDDNTPAVKNPYWYCGYMTMNMVREMKREYESIQCDCRFSSREGSWRDNLGSDWDSLYKFLKSGCNKNSLEPESYKRLCDKAYIHEDKVQIMLTHRPLQDIIAENVRLPEGLKAYSDEFDRKCYEQSKNKYPEHIRPIVKLYCTNELGEGNFLPYLIETMLEKGMLLPLDDIQKKTVFSVMSYDQ